MGSTGTIIALNDQDKYRKGVLKMSDYAIDPVCEMKVEKRRASFDRLTADYNKIDKAQVVFDRVTGNEQDETFYFCSERCKALFEEHPERYLNKGRAISGLM
jgi:YHS domain-containing protein